MGSAINRQLDLHIAPLIHSSEALKGPLGMTLQRDQNQSGADHYSNNERMQCA